MEKKWRKFELRNMCKNRANYHHATNMPSAKLRGTCKDHAKIFNIVRRTERLRERRIENRYPTTRKKIGPYKAIWGL